MRNLCALSVSGDEAPKPNTKMRIKNITFAVSALILMVSLLGLKAQTPLTVWNFNQISEGANANPSPTTGYGSASALGLANSYNGTNSLSNPEVVNLTGSSNGGTNAWQISGGGAAPNGGDGWSTAAAIGSQGVQFSGSTFGYYRVMLTFDVNASPDAPADLQVEYTTDGTFWWNATNISVSGTAMVTTNAGVLNGTNGTVAGTYIQLASGWNNQITVDLSGLSGVDNNANFAVRLVNASTGTNCVDTTGNVYDNNSGSWSFNNVTIQGVSIDTIADWTFASYGKTTGGQFQSQSGYVENPIPEINIGISNFAACIGFNTDYNFAGTIGSTNAPDVTSTGGTSTPNNPYCWRLRGAPGNGWYSASPIGSQGAEFDVNTVNFSNVVVSFDVYFTSQAEARMCVLYTTNGWTNTLTANSLYYGSNPNYILTNDPASDLYDPDIVAGTYFYETAGQNTYDDFVVDFTGLPDVANNPYFGIRFVNAGTGLDDVAYNGGSYNDNSGNCRMANVSFGGQFSGSTPPILTAAANATVDNPFTNTFTDDPIWRANIYAIYVNGALLTNAASYNVAVAGELILKPALDSILQVDGVDYISVFATNYSVAKVTQPILAGALKKLAITTQPQGPSASGGTLLINPALELTDQYGNTTTNPYPNVAVTAFITNSASSHWILGGATNQTEVNGVIEFTNLSATLTSASTVSGAVITLKVTNFATATNINLTSFNIGAAPVPFTPGNLAILQVDTVTNGDIPAVADNVTFSIVEIKPSVAGQTTPVNIVPASATSSNALREATSGTTGRLALSDDGTLLCFAAFVDGSAFTLDETLNLNRAAAGMNCSNQVAIGATYTSTSLGGSQARAAVTVDDQNYYADDKGGLYYGQGNIAFANVDGDNNVVVKSFDTVPYVETQKVPQGSFLPVIYTLGFDNTTVGDNLGTDPNATDFYLVSTNGGQTYDILYTCDQATSPSGANIGVINKFSQVPGIYFGNPGWVTNGTWTNATDIDGMFVTTNGNGGAYIYYTTGSGGTAGNSVVRITDTNGWNQPITIISSNVIYTTTGNASLKGLTFVPQYLPYTNELIPPPILASTAVQTNTTFSITTTPDDPQWRSDMGAVYVNGTLLPSADYSTTAAGQITFFGTQSALFQTLGTNIITFGSTNYSTNSISQILVGTASQLVFSTQPTAPVADGGLLAKQPVVTVEDAVGDAIAMKTNVTVAAVQNTWTLAGTLAVTSSASGVGIYSGLSAFSSAAVSGATIQATCGSLTKTSSAFNIPAPVDSIIRGAKTSSGNFTFTFTNYTGLSYSVLGTNNIGAPLPWPAIGTTIESPAGSGIYKFTNSVGTNQFYYILKQAP
jgi:hypothetical protein